MIPGPNGVSRGEARRWYRQVRGRSHWLSQASLGAHGTEPLRIHTEFQYSFFFSVEVLSGLKKGWVRRADPTKQSPLKLKELNARVKKRQLMLEEPKLQRKLALIREILTEEIHAMPY